VFFVEKTYKAFIETKKGLSNEMWQEAALPSCRPSGGEWIRPPRALGKHIRMR